MAGRKKPTQLKVIEGNPGKRHLPDNEPKPRPLVSPKCPKYLHEEAKKVWKKLAPVVARMGLLTEADQDAFANLCTIRARLIMLNHRIKRGCDLEDFNDGGSKPSADSVNERQYMALYRQYAGEFGLTPRGRTGLAVQTDDHDDDLLD